MDKSGMKPSQAYSNFFWDENIPGLRCDSLKDKKSQVLKYEQILAEHVKIQGLYKWRINSGYHPSFASFFSSVSGFSLNSVSDTIHWTNTVDRGVYRVLQDVCCFFTLDSQCTCIDTIWYDDSMQDHVKSNHFKVHWEDSLYKIC